MRKGVKNSLIGLAVIAGLGGTNRGCINNTYQSINDLGEVYLDWNHNERHERDVLATRASARGVWAIDHDGLNRVVVRDDKDEVLYDKKIPPGELPTTGINIDIDPPFEQGRVYEVTVFDLKGDSYTKKVQKKELK